MLGHAPRATNACLLEDSETNLSGARGWLFLSVGEKILLTSAIVNASICRTCHPERNLHGQKLMRCACSSILLSSCPEQKVTKALLLARHATKSGAHWLRSETGYAWNLTTATAMALGKGCSENLSGVKAFGCFRDYSETKL